MEPDIIGYSPASSFAEQGTVSEFDVALDTGSSLTYWVREHRVEVGDFWDTVLHCTRCRERSRPIGMLLVGRAITVYAAFLLQHRACREARGH